MKILKVITFFVVFTTWMLIPDAGDLFAQQAVTTVSFADIDFSQGNQFPSETLEPRIEIQVETIRISPEDLRSSSIGPVFINPMDDPNERRRPRLVRKLVKEYLFFGWVGKFKGWLFSPSSKKENRKERELREEWEMMLGYDYFKWYYKYDEVRKKIKGHTRFKVYGFDGKARFKFRGFDFPDIKVTLKKRF